MIIIIIISIIIIIIIITIIIIHEAIIANKENVFSNSLENFPISSMAFSPRLWALLSNSLSSACSAFGKGNNLHYLCTCTIGFLF